MSSEGALCGACPEGRAAGLTRRSFLQALGLAGGAVAVGPMLAQVAYAADPTYSGDVLVVLSLRGGFDGLSAIAPVGDPDYARLRPSIAVPTSTALDIGDRLFALHPALAPLKPHWDARTFGAVHAVGTPDQSRSHFQATEELERAAPGTSLRTGWLNRAMGARPAAGAFAAMQVGDGVAAPLLAGPAPVLALSRLKDFALAGDGDGPRFAAAIGAMHEGSSQPWSGPALSTLSALAAAGRIVSASPGPQNGAVYPATDLGTALADVAVLIRAGNGLQSVGLDMGDWDMHSALGKAGTGAMAEHLGELAKALAAFAADLGPALLGRTSLVTMSEFGRRVQENGSAGVDHGHGNAVLFLGGSLNGGRVHGRWPGLTEPAMDDGDLAGTTDYRDVLAEVLVGRCGQPGLDSVFPGYQPTSVGLAKAR